MKDAILGVGSGFEPPVASPAEKGRAKENHVASDSQGQVYE